jgi:DNA transformation protein and related proteins
MSVSLLAKEKFVKSLGRIAPIMARSMFGGVGLYSEGLFFALIDNDTLYFKVDDSNRQDYLAEKMGPFSPYGPGGMVMQYYQVPDAVLGNVRKLKSWMEKAILVARRAGKKKVATKKKAKKRLL